MPSRFGNDLSRAESPDTIAGASVAQVDLGAVPKHGDQSTEREIATIICEVDDQSRNAR